MTRRLLSSPVVVRAAEVVVVAIAAVPIVAYLHLAYASIGYPYPLEWMEGGSLDVIARVLAGRPVYTAPSVEYVPYIYAPLYYWVSAGAAGLLGLTFLTARLVSFASICGVAAFIWKFVRYEEGSRVEAFAAIGLFAATDYQVLSFFHIARVDSLYLLLLLAGFYVLRTRQRAWSAVAAGVLLWLAFMTKQIALLTATVALPIALVGTPKRVLTAAATFGALVIATNVVMNAHSGGWWGYFIYRLPLLHDVEQTSLHEFWRYDIGRIMPLAAIAAALLIVCSTKAELRRTTFYGGLLAGVLTATWITRLYFGSGNVLMPAYAALALTLPLGIRSLPVVRAGRLVVLGALALQLAIVLQTAAALAGGAGVPDAAARASGDRLVTFLQSVHGEVLIWDQRFVETRAGKMSWGLEAAADDVLWSYDVEAREALKRSIVDACRDGRFAGAIDPPEWLQAEAPFGPPIALEGIREMPMIGPSRSPAKFYPLPASDARP